MSKDGLPTELDIDATGIRVAVVTATWNQEICDRIHARAIEKGRELGAEIADFRVVGALELPVVVQALARTYDAVVAGGCVVRGGTPHFDYVCDSVTAGLTRIALDEETPIGNAVLTVNTYEQAVDRAGFEDSAEDKGAESMEAALATVLALRQINN